MIAGGTGAGYVPHSPTASGHPFVHKSELLDFSPRHVDSHTPDRRTGTAIGKLARTTGFTGITVIALLLGASACTPTVKVATDEPITINLNVNIRHEILVKVDRELDDLFGKDSELF